MEPRYAASSGSEFASYAELYQDSAYSAFDQEHRSGGSFGLSLMRVHQDPIDLIDPAVPDEVFMRADNDLGEVLFDIGHGIVSTPGKSGSITYYPAYTEVRTRVAVPHTVTALAFEQEKLKSIMASTDCEATAFDPLASKMTTHPQASKLMDEMWRVVVNDGPAAGLYLDGLTLQFIALMACDASIAPIGADHVEDRRITRAIDYIEAHLDQPLNIAELAHVAALSPSQFSRVFKATTEQAVWAFVQRRRIERARTLLLHTPLPIGEIAFECGFSSQNHMTNLIKRHLGITPGALRALDLD